MRKRFWFFILLIIIGRSAQAEDTTANAAKSLPTVHDLGSRRELFVDDALIESLSGKPDLPLHSPTPSEIAIESKASRLIGTN